MAGGVRAQNMLALSMPQRGPVGQRPRKRKLHEPVKPGIMSARIGAIAVLVLSKTTTSLRDLRLAS